MRIWLSNYEFTSTFDLIFAVVCGFFFQQKNALCCESLTVRPHSLETSSQRDFSLFLQWVSGEPQGECSEHMFAPREMCNHQNDWDLNIWIIR